MANFVRNVATSGANAAQTVSTVTGNVRSLVAVHVAYSAAPTQTGVTVTLNSGAGADYDILLTTGSANDLERSTALARNMVTIFGMSRLGPIKFADRDELVFLGREMGLHRVPSESLAAKIDAEIASIIDECWQRALKLLKSQPETLALLANGLLEKETLEDAELAKIWKNLKTKTS